MIFSRNSTSFHEGEAAAHLVAEASLLPSKSHVLVWLLLLLLPKESRGYELRLLLLHAARVHHLVTVHLLLLPREPELLLLHRLGVEPSGHGHEGLGLLRRPSVARGPKRVKFVVAREEVAALLHWLHRLEALLLACFQVAQVEQPTAFRPHISALLLRLWLLLVKLSEYVIIWGLLLNAECVLRLRLKCVKAHRILLGALKLAERSIGGWGLLLHVHVSKHVVELLRLLRRGVCEKETIIRLLLHLRLGWLGHV